MPMHGGHLWRKHPAVRTGDQLSTGERAADHLKAAFGSWTFLIILNVFIAAWIGVNVLLPHADRWDVFPFILLNLGLSWLAAQQGGALQIAANRGDRINAEVAQHTAANTEKLVTLETQVLDLQHQVHALLDLTTAGGLADVLAEVKAGREDFAATIDMLAEAMKRQ